LSFFPFFLYREAPAEFRVPPARFSYNRPTSQFPSPPFCEAAMSSLFPAFCAVFFCLFSIPKVAFILTQTTLLFWSRCAILLPPVDGVPSIAVSPWCAGQDLCGTLIVYSFPVLPRLSPEFPSPPSNFFSFPCFSPLRWTEVPVENISSFYPISSLPEA